MYLIRQIMSDDPMKASISSFKYDNVKNHNSDATGFFSDGGTKKKWKKFGDKYLPAIIVSALILLGAIPLLIKFLSSNG